MNQAIEIERVKLQVGALDDKLKAAHHRIDKLEIKIAAAATRGGVGGGAIASVLTLGLQWALQALTGG